MGVVMGLLVVSFGIWGIGDIFRRVRRSSDVATIGGTEISIEQFRQQFHDRVQQLSRQLGRGVTPEQARAVGLDRQVLGELLAQAALDQKADQLRLGMSNAEVAKQIAEEPAFRGPNGQFDRSRFEQLIRQAGYTEPRFVAEQRRVLLRRQVADSVIGDVKPPRAELEAVQRYQDEQRSIEYFVLGPDQAGTVEAPTDDVLAKYFADHKALFRAPEYRKIALLSLTPSDVARTIEISPDEARRAYEGNKDRYSTPEKRQIEQVMFPNPEAAAKAARQLANGVSFEQLAKERGLSLTDIDLGLLAKKDMVDPAIADAAFSLKEGATSGPITGRFGTAILRVTKIEPGSTKSFAAVEGEIVKKLALDRAKEQVSKLRDKIEDELASGLRVEEVAKKLNLQARIIDAADRSGRAPDGQPVPELPKGVDVIAGAFASDVGVDNDALRLPEGGYVWFDVLGVTPAHDRTLGEVKDQVEARWRDDQIASRLKAKGDKILDELKGGAPFEAIAAAEKVEVKRASGLKRQGEANGLAPNIVAKIFGTAKSAAASTEGKNPTERVIFRVTDVVVPPFDPNSAEARQAAGTLGETLGDDLLGEYVTRAEADLGVSINRAGLNQAVGGAPGQ